jgi:hypothetical protein
MLVLLAAGCSSSDSPTNNGTTDTTPPTIASAVAVDQSHVDVEFSEAVNKDSAERSDHYLLVTTLRITAGAPAAEIEINSAVLDDDDRTVHLTTNSPMQNVSYDLYVVNVSDLRGNEIAQGASSTFTGSTEQDVTPPTIVDRSPAPGQTGVGVGEAVAVQFSEPMDYPTVVSAFSWTRSGGTVSYEVETQDANVFLFRPTSPLLNATVYTVTIGSGAQDWAGNPLAATMWNFTTTAQVDNTPPTLVSSTPANNATNVNVVTSLVMTFSEPVDPTSLDNVLLFPDVGEGVATWSNGDRTITYDPYDDMMSNTQYSLLIIPGAVRDLAGNGNADPINIVWTTGSTLSTGGFAGTISGPNSAAATGPGGAIVVAVVGNPFETDDFPIAGSAVVASNGSYTVQHLAAGSYFPISVLDTNDDGEVDPDYGDAFGAYGVDFASQTGEIDSVTVGNSIVSGINFSLYDPSLIAGRISYVGDLYNSCCYPLYIGAFDTTGFDIDNLGDPDFSTQANWPDYPEYRLNEIDGELADGTYYVGAFLDADFNGSPNTGDPMVFYGGVTPAPVTVENGSDALHVDITLDDDVMFAAGSWKTQVPSAPTRRASAIRRIADAVRGALE